MTRFARLPPRSRATPGSSNTQHPTPTGLRYYSPTQLHKLILSFIRTTPTSTTTTPSTATTPKSNTTLPSTPRSPQDRDCDTCSPGFRLLPSRRLSPSISRLRQLQLSANTHHSITSSLALSHSFLASSSESHRLHPLLCPTCNCTARPKLHTSPWSLSPGRRNRLCRTSIVEHLF